MEKIAPKAVATVTLIGLGWLAEIIQLFLFVCDARFKFIFFEPRMKEMH